MENYVSKKRNGMENYFKRLSRFLMACLLLSYYDLIIPASPMTPQSMPMMTTNATQDTPKIRTINDQTIIMVSSNLSPPILISHFQLPV